MTQRVFDIENEKDMADLWGILPDEVVKIEKDKMNTEYCVYIYSNFAFVGTKLLEINWHDKTEITRPIQEATEDDIGKICYFWNDDDPSEYGQLLYVSSSPEDSEGKYQQGHNEGSWKHCRRLTKQEIEELI